MKPERLTIPQGYSILENEDGPMGPMLDVVDPAGRVVSSHGGGHDGMRWIRAAASAWEAFGRQVGRRLPNAEPAALEALVEAAEAELAGRSRGTTDELRDALRRVRGDK